MISVHIHCVEIKVLGHMQNCASLLNQKNTLGNVLPQVKFKSWISMKEWMNTNEVRISKYYV